MSGLKQEIAQQLPFSSAEQEALLNIVRTADCLSRAMQRKTRPWGVTSTQYNVLRILRGASPDALPCTAIGERMITAEPDITRLLSRLKSAKLVEQRRDKADKRVVLTSITRAGLELLESMDSTVQSFPHETLGHLSEKDIRELIRLLESARSKCLEADRVLSDTARPWAKTSPRVAE